MATRTFSPMSTISRAPTSAKTGIPGGSQNFQGAPWVYRQPPRAVNPQPPDIRPPAGGGLQPPDIRPPGGSVGVGSPFGGRVSTMPIRPSNMPANRGLPGRTGPARPDIRPGLGGGLQPPDIRPTLPPPPAPPQPPRLTLYGSHYGQPMGQPGAPTDYSQYGDVAPDAANPFGRNTGVNYAAANALMAYQQGGGVGPMQNAPQFGAPAPPPPRALNYGAASQPPQMFHPSAYTMGGAGAQQPQTTWGGQAPGRPPQTFQPTYQPPRPPTMTAGGGRTPAFTPSIGNTVQPNPYR